MAEQYDCDRELLESRNSDLNLIMFAVSGLHTKPL